MSEAAPNYFGMNLHGMRYPLSFLLYRHMTQLTNIETQQGTLILK